MNLGIIGGIAGSILGIAGGVIGTYFSIKNTDGPRERKFMIKASAVSWSVGIIFITLLIILPNTYKWFMWIPYSILLPCGIVYCNKKLLKIKQEEMRQRSLSSDKQHPGI